MQVHINVQLPKELCADLERQIQKLTTITFKKKIEGPDNLYIFSAEKPIDLVQLGMLISKQHHKFDTLTITV